MGSGHSFADSTRRYEAWLAQYCKIDDVGLAAKREKIKAAPFPFLRGTFYRWPHHFAAVKPRIAQAAKILSIGDTHIENFGTWRDEEGRHALGRERLRRGGGAAVDQRSRAARDKRNPRGR